MTKKQFRKLKRIETCIDKYEEYISNGTVPMWLNITTKILAWIFSTVIVSVGLLSFIGAILILSYLVLVNVPLIKIFGVIIIFSSAVCMWTVLNKKFDSNFCRTQLEKLKKKREEIMR